MTALNHVTVFLRLIDTLIGAKNGKLVNKLKDRELGESRKKLSTSAFYFLKMEHLKIGASYREIKKLTLKRSF